QQFAGVELDEGDVVLVGEREDAFAGVGGADREVVHAAGAADAHLAFVVEAVVAQPVVAGGAAVGREGVGWGAGGESWVVRCRARWALFVVMLLERVEVVLELAQRSGWRSGGQPTLQGLVKALDLRLGLGMAGRSVRVVDTERRKWVFERVAAAGE